MKYKIFLRIGIFFLALCLLLCSALPAFAAVSPSSAVYQTLFNGFYSEKNEIDISEYRLSPDQLSDLYRQIRLENPELFHVPSSYEYYSNLNSLVTKLKLKYTNQSNYREMLRFLRTMVAEIVSRVNPNWSNLEKILFVHDDLAARYTYDTSYSYYDAYSFYYYKTGVCQAYSLAFHAVLEELGIQAVCMVNDPGNHLWSAVYLDGAWYQMDVTWDDPTGSPVGQVSHSYFLLSDNAIRQRESHDYWVCFSGDITCSSAYDSYWLHDVNSAFAYLDGYWYYLDTTGNLMRTASLSTPGTKIFSPPNMRWYAPNSPHSYYTRHFSGLASYNGLLYFNNASTIYSYNPATGEMKIVHQPTLSEKSIYGLYIYRGELIYQASTEWKNTTDQVFSIQLGTPSPLPQIPDDPVSSISPVSSAPVVSSPASVTSTPTSRPVSSRPESKPVSSQAEATSSRPTSSVAQTPSSRPSVSSVAPVPSSLPPISAAPQPPENVPDRGGGFQFAYLFIPLGAIGLALLARAWYRGHY